MGASSMAMGQAPQKRRSLQALIRSAVANANASEQSKADTASKQVRYAVNNRSAQELATLLEKQFSGVAGVQIVPDGPNNTLLLTAKPGDLDELLNTLAKLDRRPQEVVVQILILRMPANREADGKMQPADFDAQQLSGAAERVLGHIEAWQRTRCLHRRGSLPAQDKGKPNRQAG